MNPDPHGPVYYLFRNLGRMIWGNKIARTAVTAGPFVALVVIWLARALCNPYLVAVRRQSPAIVTALISLAVVALAQSFVKAAGPRWFVTGLVAAFWIAVATSPYGLFHNLSLYGCWRAMEKHELRRLPVTHHERIYPLSMVSRIVEDRLTQSHFTVSPFEMQMDKGQLYWVAQKTPAGMINTMALENVTGLVQVAASSVAVDIQHHKVEFEYGRDLFFIRDLGHYVLPRQLGFLDIFDKELDREDLAFRVDDQGRWVMVMAVIDWDGIFPFCIPTFGGVFICPQKGHGDVRWVKPAEMATIPYLRGQNLVPETLTKYYAESWKFNQGLSGYLRNQGVTKITSIPEDTAQQPFAVYFKDVNGQDGLYQFFALEPDGKSAGLSKMLLFDPQGYKETPVAYYYDFEAKGEELVGPARIAETIKASDIHVDWKQAGTGTFVIAESRPLIKDRGGKREFHWFNSVVTHQQGSGQPRVVLADPRSLRVDWLEPSSVQKLLDE